MPVVPAAGDTVYRKFTTRAFSTGVPTTLGGSPVVSIYKDDSLTQSTTGVTLTADFDNVTGLNHVTIDTSADGTFYANGHHFELVITTGTVGGVSVVGEVVGSFDLASAAASADIVSINGTTFAGSNVPAILADGVAHGGTPGSSTATLAMQAMNVTNPSGDALKLVCSNSESGAGGAALFMDTFSTDPTVNIYREGNAGGDPLGTVLIDSSGNSSGLALRGSGTSAGLSIFSAADGIDISVNGHGVSVLAGTGKKALLLAGDAANDGLAIAAGAGSPIDIFNADGTVNIDAAAVWDLATSGHTTGGSFGAAVTSGSGPSAATIAAAVWDEVNTAATHNTDNSAGKQLRTISGNTGTIYTGTCPSQAGMTSTQIKLDSGASSTNNVYRYDVISIVSGTNAGDSRIITGYVGSTKVATVDADWTTQPDGTSVFEITPTARGQVVNYMAGQDPATLVWGAATRTLTTLPTIPTNWLTADGLASDAVAEIQAGLSTYAGGRHLRSDNTPLPVDERTGLEPR